MKKQNTFLKVAAVALVGVLAVGAVSYLIPSIDNQNPTPAVKSGYVETSKQSIALVDNYFENIQKTQYSGTTISSMTLYANTDGDLEIGTAKIGVDGEAETQIYAVEAGKNTIIFNEPLIVGMDETVMVGGGKTNVDLRSTSSTTSSFGDIATLEDGALSTDFIIADERLNISMDICYMESSATSSIFDSIVSDTGTFSALTSVNMKSVPFTYQNLTLYENQTVVKIGIPVKTITDYTADSIFTVYLISYDEPLTTFTQVTEYKLTIPANTFSSNTIDQWYYFDTNIEVGENQTLGFCSSSDSVFWGFLSSSKSQYILYNKLFSGYGTSAYGFFDITTKVEMNYTLEEYIEYLKSEDTSAYAKSLLSGKKISILGDSISTCEGISDNIIYNTTLSPNQSRYYAKDVEYATTEATLELDSWENTYWGQAITNFDLELCVNNSWRGTSVSTARGADSCTSGTRATQLHNDNKDIIPDIIIVYIGTNDKSANAPVFGLDSIDDLYNGTSYTADCSYFDIAYATMVLKIQNQYPNADIFLCNLIYDDSLGKSYNDTIAKIATKFDCTLVDFSALVPTWSWSGHTMDGLHPNQIGFDLMADILISTIQESFIQY